jgi:hypothetical protein
METFWRWYRYLLTIAGFLAILKWVWSLKDPVTVLGGSPVGVAGLVWIGIGVAALIASDKDES